MVFVRVVFCLLKRLKHYFYFLVFLSQSRKCIVSEG